MDWKTIAIALSLAWTKASFVLGVVLGLAALMTWAERKQSALMQDRIGANRASILGFRFWGLFHIITDGIKMMTKEDFIPPFADKMIFRIAPVIGAVCGTIGFFVIPFGPVVTALGVQVPMVIFRSDIGMLLLFAALGLTVFGAFLGGISSNNKWATLGTLRAAAQMAAYEAALAVSLAGVFMVYGTLDLYKIANAQAGFFSAVPFLPAWGIFVQPLAFLLFAVAAIAENKRVPFDLPEGESEIIGYFLEYSGMRFGLYFMAEMIETILFSAVITVLFFGGWHMPGLDYASMPWWLAVGVGSAVFWGKVMAGCWCFLLVRWSLPRFRFDQLLNLGWRWLLPLSLANAFVTAAVLLFLRSGAVK
jgi:NADH-quinone oxidoreductase subunit H